MTADAGADRGESAETARPRPASGRSGSGRPRDGRIDAAVIAATRELLLETGYPGLTLSAVAVRAGTTTAAIYRRWSGKTHLVPQAALSAEPIPAPDESGDARSAIRALVEAVRAIFDRPEVRVALPGLIADTVADPDLHARMITRLSGNLTAFDTRVGREHREGDHLPVLVEAVARAVDFPIPVRRDAALDEAWVDELTELLTGGRPADPPPDAAGRR